MAINFPDSPTNAQTYNDPGTGQTWTYELATNSWTASSLAVTGGVVYKGSVDITAAPPTGAKAGEQWSVGTGGTANAGYGPGVTGTITKGGMVMYTGTGWLETSHSVPDATTIAKGIDTQKWSRTGTVLSPATTGDVVNISAGTAALPGLTPVGDPNTGIFFPAADSIALAEGGSERLRLDASGSLLVGTSASVPVAGGLAGTLQVVGSRNSFARYGNDTFGTTLSLGKSRGPSAGIFSIVASGDSLGILQWAGSDGTDLQTEAARIEAQVDGTPGADDMPGRIVLSTTAAGASTPTTRMTIKASGVVNIAATTVYADNTAAKAGGLVAGDIYRKADGTLMITF